MDYDLDMAFHFVLISIIVVSAVVSWRAYRRISRLLSATEAQLKLAKGSGDPGRDVQARLALAIESRLFVLGESRIEDPIERRTEAMKTAAVILDTMRFARLEVSDDGHAPIED